MTSLHDRARHFRSLHVPGRPLVLPNAWDVASARIIAAAGASAMATTSAGVAWALGAADGDRLDRASAVGQVAAIAAAVDLPVTADVEGGFESDEDGVAGTVRAVLAAGAVGINIEDGTRSPAEHVRRIGAARAAADAEGVPLFINARIDTYLAGLGDRAGRLEETLKRAADCLAAGADGVFVPGVVAPEIVSALVKGVDAPLNVLVGHGAPAVAELAGLGVARISAGSSIVQAAHGLVRDAARELLTEGTCERLADGSTYGEMNALMSVPR
ncbi:MULTISPECIES: isocitrate lyase/PEP mutase family protein [unclassified Streptomyces]|uniref:isocitrate lyase/PEP mutase family protein n=1 Tax=unclassified Streptomyces TaxID=2593676 RepID=UPI0033CCF371